MSADHAPNPAVPAVKLASLAALLAVVVGGMVLIGWAFDIAVLKSILPGWFPMKANAAVGFILIGIALWLATRQSTISNPHSAILFSRLARFCGLQAGLIGLLTLCEYIFGWNLGIDQWLFREPVGAVGTSHPGRMAPEAALNFVLLSVALWNISDLRKTLRVVLVPVILGLLVSTLALAATLSYLTPSLGTYGWFGLPVMAIHAAMMFAILGVTVIAASWQPDVLQWSISRRTTAAFACGMILLVFIGFNTSRSQFWMEEANSQIAYTEKMQGDIGNILIDVIEAQTHARDYIITGDEQLKTHYLEAKANSNAKLDALHKLITGNLHHQQHFARIEERVDAELQWLQQAIEAERTGISDVARNKRVIHGEALLDNLHSTFDQIESEHHQLIQKLKRESENVSRFSYLTIFIGTLTSLLIFLAVIFRLNFAANARKRAKTTLQESEERHRQIIQTSMDGFWIADTKGRILEVNDAYCQLIGYAREELLNMHIADVEAKETTGETAQHIQEIMTKVHARFETRHQRKDGQLLDIEVSVVHRPYPEDGLFFIFLRDITERKRAEQAQTRLVAILEATPDFVGFADAKDTHILFINKAGRKMTGLSEDEDVTKLKIADVHPEWMNKKFNDEINPVAIRDGKWVGDGAFLNRSNGREIPVIMALLSHKAPSGEIEFFSTISRDITERKQTEAALIHSRDLMRYVIEHDQSGVAVHDRDLKYLYVSQRYLQEYKVKDRDVIGKHHYDVFPDLPQKWRDVHQKVLAGEILSGEDDPYVREDGTVDWTRWECRPWYESDGSVGGIIVYTEIINERKKAKTQLAEQLDELRRWHDATLGREMRILELKHEVNELLGQAGQPPRYPSAEQSNAE